MRRVAIPIYVLVALAELIHWMIVPLIPAFAARFSLSEVESGALVASTGLTTLAVSIPAGMLGDRLGPRRLTLGAGAAMAAAGCAQALAPSYALLLAARLAFGAGFGIMWTTGLAWLAATGGARRSLGATVTSAGVGTVVAPGFAGVTAQALGLDAPFWIAGVAAAVVTVLLAIAPSGRQVATADERPTVATVRAAGRQPAVVAAVTAILLAGLAGGTISLLAPLELHAAGLSGASIGLAFSVAAVVFIAGSALTVWLSELVVRVPAVLVAAVAFAVTLSPVTASGATLAIFAAMCLSAPLRGLLYTAAYPLGTADGGAPAAGTVMGLLNGAWALTTVLGPLAAGALAASVGPRLTYGLLQALAVAAVCAVWLWARPAPGRLAGSRDI